METKTLAGTVLDLAGSHEIHWIRDDEGNPIAVPIELAHDVIIVISHCHSAEIAKGLATRPPNLEMLVYAVRDYMNDCFNAIAGTDDPAIRDQALKLSRKRARVSIEYTEEEATDETESIVRTGV